MKETITNHSGTEERHIFTLNDDVIEKLIKESMSHFEKALADHVLGLPCYIFSKDFQYNLHQRPQEDGDRTIFNCLLSTATAEEEDDDDKHKSNPFSKQELVKPFHFPGICLYNQIDEALTDNTSKTINGPLSSEEIQSVINLIQTKLERKNSKAKDGSLIGDRVYNGRKEEDHLCESLTDEEISQLMEECHEKIFGRSLSLSKEILMFLSGFAIAIYKLSKNRFETYTGKLAHMHRVVKEKVGEMCGCGLRAFQKGVQWFQNYIGACSENEIWAKREEEKYSNWKAVLDEIIAFLSSRLCMEVNPH